MLATTASASAEDSHVHHLRHSHLLRQVPLRDREAPGAGDFPQEEPLERGGPSGTQNGVHSPFNWKALKALRGPGFHLFLETFSCGVHSVS